MLKYLLILLALLLALAIWYRAAVASAWVVFFAEGCGRQCVAAPPDCRHAVDNLAILHV
ncbi:hypothetical protein [Trichloromonas sp.]|uniref:hypothetical protein n=1 Tax=Trichloromonas sp. TaxID=3069249 RepID=UPI002A377D36|nr:hypothetical protein [Trichloromonas sp.]